MRNIANLQFQGFVGLIIHTGGVAMARINYKSMLNNNLFYGFNRIIEETGV